MIRYITLNGITKYYESIFDTSKDFELFAEYWDAKILTIEI
jgi:hypothetical protein